MTATLQTIDHRPALRFERRLAHPVERVWRAVTVPAELERWMPAAVDWTPRAGEVVDAGGQPLEVTEVDPPRALAWDLEGNRYRIELMPEGEGCTMVFTFVFDDRAIAAQWAAGWDTYLNRLEPHLEGGFLSEGDAHEGFVERNDRYAELFGVDPEIGRRVWRAMQS